MKYGPKYNQRRDWKERPSLTRRVSPKGHQRSDQAIYRDVCEMMTGDGRLDAGEIEVHVENAEVTLTGMVESRESKRLAEEIAESAFGVADVHNRLCIKGEE